MNTIERTLKLLLTSEIGWFGRLTAFPTIGKDLSKQDFTYYKSIKNFNDCKSQRTYNVIKTLLQTQGVRSVHPAWFFIHRKNFEKDKFIFEEDTYNGFDTLNLVIPRGIHIPHKIQIKETLNIYYSLLVNSKMIKCFFNEDCEFTNKYTEFKELHKYFFFPIVEKKSNRRYIDLTYDFDNIIDNINIEINEPHHDFSYDKKREIEIYYNSGNRIIQHYVEKDTIENFMQKFFFRLTYGIFNKNVYAGLVFNAFIIGIIDNLIIAIFFSELKKESNDKKLTWELFRKYCSSVRIELEPDYLFTVEKELEHITDDIEKQKELDELFYNCTYLHKNTLLTETGYDYYLMQINSTQSPDSVRIKRMYSKYRQEYEKVMSMLLSNEREEKSMLNKFFKPKMEKLMELMELFKIKK